MNAPHQRPEQHYYKLQKKHFAKKCKNKSCRDAFSPKTLPQKPIKQVTMHTEEPTTIPETQFPEPPLLPTTPDVVVLEESFENAQRIDSPNYSQFKLKTPSPETAALLAIESLQPLPPYQHTKEDLHFLGLSTALSDCRLSTKNPKALPGIIKPLQINLKHQTTSDRFLFPSRQGTPTPSPEMIALPDITSDDDDVFLLDARPKTSTPKPKLQDHIEGIFPHLDVDSSERKPAKRLASSLPKLNLSNNAALLSEESPKNPSPSREHEFRFPTNATSPSPPLPAPSPSPPLPTPSSSPQTIPRTKPRKYVTFTDLIEIIPSTDQIFIHPTTDRDPPNDQQDSRPTTTSNQPANNTKDVLLPSSTTRPTKKNLFLPTLESNKTTPPSPSDSTSKETTGPSRSTPDSSPQKKPRNSDDAQENQSDFGNLVSAIDTVQRSKAL